MTNEDKGLIRDAIAIAALHAMLSRPGNLLYGTAQMPVRAYEIADAMLKARHDTQVSSGGSA